MDLSSFGVESDNYPNIHVSINMITGSSECKKTYYNPKYKDSTYSLSKAEIQQISLLLKHADLAKLKNKYSVNSSDQPTSTVTFYTNTGEITIKDYGLKGEDPLQEMYKIAYKADILF